MKKRKFAIRIGFILVIIGLSFLFFQRGHQKKIQKVTEEIMTSCPRYEMDVAFYPEEKRIAVIEKVMITNDKAKAFQELYFHLYPNAFKSLDDIPFPKEEIQQAYPDGFEPGYLSIKKVSDEYSKVNFEIEDTILKVMPSKPLEPQDKLVLTIEFDVKIPPALGRFGYGQNTFNLANWYPILAVYDEKGWHKDPYYCVGDPFYSEMGLYDVSIRAPKAYKIAASGSLQEKIEEAGNNVIWNFKTELVRDFAWIGSNKFAVESATVDNTQLMSYYFEGENKKYGLKALEYAKNALGFFNEYFGKYPYSHYSVVASDFYIGGMEFPNLVMIGNEFYGSSGFFEYVVVHETAHQWWYGLVGNNQVEEAWLDEALAEYSTLLYYDYFYGRKNGQKVYEQAILNPYKLYEAAHTPGPILRPLSEFADWKDYSSAVYHKGTIMVKDLEGRIGKGKLQQALRYYFEQNLYKNATTADFIKALNHVTGVDWTDYINDCLSSTDILDKAS